MLALAPFDNKQGRHSVNRHYTTYPTLLLVLTSIPPYRPLVKLVALQPHIHWGLCIGHHLRLRILPSLRPHPIAVKL